MAPVAGRLSALLAAIVSIAAFGAEGGFPNKPIRLIVPFPAGVADTLARVVAPSMGKSLGQPVIVENRPGGSGQIAAQEALRAGADGHAVLMGHIGTHALNPHLFTKLAYDPDRDFTPLTHLLTTPNLLIVSNAVSASNVAELIALAKSKPGVLSYGSPGSGSSGHLAAELLKSLTGINVVHIPYKGTAQALQDLIGGQIDLMFDTIAQSGPQAKAGKVRALAVAAGRRHASAPDVPTMIEAGFPGWETGPWFGLFVRAGTDAAVTRRSADEAVKAVTEPTVRDRFAALGANVIGGSPQEFAQFIAAERARWGKVIKDAGIRAD